MFYIASSENKGSPPGLNNCRRKGNKPDGKSKTDVHPAYSRGTTFTISEPNLIADVLQ